MALSTYSDLVAAIPKWAMRTADTEFEAQVPDFITLAEDRIGEISAELRHLRFELCVSGSHRPFWDCRDEVGMGAERHQMRPLKVR